MSNLNGGYLSRVNESLTFVKEILDPKTFALIEKKSIEIKSLLEEKTLVKIPFIGDFSAGKSSLINALLNRPSLLPVDIQPMTAVSYEVYYDGSEHFIHQRGTSILSDGLLSDLGNIDTKAGDIVKVYVDNTLIRTLQDRGIILVDMPGLDSGIEAHNKAIHHYISEGTTFSILVDIEQGSLRSSTLSFLREIKQYGLAAQVFITKGDKKPESEKREVLKYITGQAKRYLDDDAKVSLTSVVDNQIEDVKLFLDGINSVKLFDQKYGSLVNDFITDLQNDVRRKASILQNSTEEILQKIEDLKVKGDKVKKELENKKTGTTSNTSQVTFDILHKVKSALEAKEAVFVSYIMNKNKDAICNEVATTMRPVMIETLKDENEKYYDQLRLDLSSILKDNEESIKFNKDGIYEGLGKIKGFADVIFKDSAKYKTIIGALGLTTSVVAPWIEVVIFFLPEILSLFKSDDKKKEKYKQVFHSKLIPEIMDKLKPQITVSVQENQRKIVEEIEKSICSEIEKQETSLKAQKDSLLNKEAEIKVQMSKADNAINQLEVLIKK